MHKDYSSKKLVILGEISAWKKQECKLLLESWGVWGKDESEQVLTVSCSAWPREAQSSVLKSCSSAVVFKLSPSICCRQWQIWIQCFLVLYSSFLAYIGEQREIWMAWNKQTDATGFVMLWKHSRAELGILSCALPELIPAALIRAQGRPDEITCIPPACTAAHFGLGLICGSEG